MCIHMYVNAHTRVRASVACVCASMVYASQVWFYFHRSRDLIDVETPLSRSSLFPSPTLFDHKQKTMIFMPNAV